MKTPPSNEHFLKLAWGYLANGNLDKALENCLNVISRDPSDPSVAAIMNAIGTAQMGQLLTKRLADVEEGLRQTMRAAFLAHPSTGPLDGLLLDHHLRLDQGHFAVSYPHWRLVRLRKMFEILGHDFAGMRVLDLGAGLGDMGAVLAGLGAEVVAAEGRAINRAYAAMRYRDLPGYSVVAFDGEKDFTALGRFDLILNFGFLEVIRNIGNVIDCCGKMADRVLVDTLVCDSSNAEEVKSYAYETAFDDHPLWGNICSRPSPAYVERHFGELGFKAERHFTKDLETDYYIYDWIPTNSLNLELNGKFLRRFWLMTRP
ncbi:hypothetical protein JCM17960_34360 [Magnetospira thiophila]